MADPSPLRLCAEPGHAIFMMFLQTRLKSHIAILCSLGALVRALVPAGPVSLNAGRAGFAKRVSPRSGRIDLDRMETRSRRDCPVALGMAPAVNPRATVMTD
jgi:hypothetical protein